MLFNSCGFVVFFLVVTGLYFALPHRFRWILMLCASCFFYMCFIPAYILILLGTIVIDYFAGIWIEEATNCFQKKQYLFMSVLTLCSVLLFFKYSGFITQNVAAIAAFLDWNYSIPSLNIILPLGLSFHTFQSLSYVIEVYRSKQKAERHFGMYALYVMYYPQLVAGPIERPQNLLPQLHEEKSFDWERCSQSLFLMLWGLFKKVVIADGLANYVDIVFNNSAQHGGWSHALATYFFAFQIYADFSGYSDIARGASKMYGIELMNNFKTPFFSFTITEFWSRWHISLSTWFRDYVYLPLGGGSISRIRHLFNLFFVCSLSGLWHGANWTFIVFGCLHGFYLAVEQTFRLSARRSKEKSRAIVPSHCMQAWKLLFTFHLVLLSMIFFRANCVQNAFEIICKIVLHPGSLFWTPGNYQCCLSILVLLFLDFFHRQTNFLDRFHSFSVVSQVLYSLALLFGIILFGTDSGTQFIYFQF